ANRIREEVDPDANIIVGSTLDTDMEGAMRVSVVATGIDASAVHADIPAPRRSLTTPIPAPVMAEPQEEEPAPELFDVPAAAEAAPEAEVADLFGAREHAVVDDVPPPAYQPATPEFEPSIEEEDDLAASFVAPVKPAPGTPSPEAMARLQSAVSKAPHAGAPRASEPVAPKPAPVEEKSRFGINSLIGRMTGGAEPSEAPPLRRQPPVQSYEEENAPTPEEERIEIPAFLRRQAN
ncbi:MAG: cell division protein FtsZ, partial [Pseudomonadota bacterium]